MYSDVSPALGVIKRQGLGDSGARIAIYTFVLSLNAKGGAVCEIAREWQSCGCLHQGPQCWTPDETRASCGWSIQHWKTNVMPRSSWNVDFGATQLLDGSFGTAFFSQKCFASLDDQLFFLVARLSWIFYHHVSQRFPATDPETPILRHESAPHPSVTYTPVIYHRPKFVFTDEETVVVDSCFSMVHHLHRTRGWLTKDKQVDVYVGEAALGRPMNKASRASHSIARSEGGARIQLGRVLDTPLICTFLS